MKLLFCVKAGQKPNQDSDGSAFKNTGKVKNPLRICYAVMHIERKQ